MSLFSHLSAVRSLRFVAHSRTASGWCGSGSGDVMVAQPGPDVMTFTESGTWTPDAGRELAFRNVFRWSRNPDADLLRLEHLRFGPAEPVYLFDLAPVAEDTWRSVAPHECRDDLYSAGMTLGSNQIELQWTVTGPNKDEDIRYWYE